jgi:transposase-like protein
VGRPDFPRSIVEFQRRFPDEGACRAYLAASRWPDGYACPRCAHAEAFILERRHLWQCKCCGYQASVTAGTVMHGTRTPLTLWFWSAYLVATHTPGISAVQLARQLGIRYKTTWLVLHKLRRAMVAPEREPLKAEVEVDEFFVGGHEAGLRGGRQRGDKALCVGAVEVRGQGSDRLRLEVIPDASAATLSGFVCRNVAAGSIVHTDGWSGYSGLAGRGFDHWPRSQRVAEADEQHLPRLHRAVSNLKSWLRGTHRAVSREHLPVYLQEFVFRHNRRITPMAAFQTLLGLGTLHQPTTYREIADHKMGGCPYGFVKG